MTPHNPLRIAPQPTYAKIRREYLDTETLHYYDIPYEYDVVSHDCASIYYANANRHRTLTTSSYSAR
jgi:hypothetical protein